MCEREGRSVEGGGVIWCLGVWVTREVELQLEALLDFYLPLRLLLDQSKGCEMGGE